MNRPVEAETAARLRNRSAGFNVVQKRMERPVALDRTGCPASRAGTQPPAPPVAEGTASVWFSASKRHSTSFRYGMLAASDPKGSEAEGAQAHPAPNPYQALGLVGR